jgi:hypothetical protein
MLMQFTTQEMNEKLLKIMLSDYLFLVKRQSTKVGYTQSQIQDLEEFIETLENNPMPKFFNLGLKFFNRIRNLNFK